MSSTYVRLQFLVLIAVTLSENLEDAIGASKQNNKIHASSKLFHNKMKSVFITELLLMNETDM